MEFKNVVKVDNVYFCSLSLGEIEDIIDIDIVFSEEVEPKNIGTMTINLNQKKFNYDQTGSILFVNGDIEVIEGLERFKHSIFNKKSIVNLMIVSWTKDEIVKKFSKRNIM